MKSGTKKLLVGAASVLAVVSVSAAAQAASILFSCSSSCTSGFLLPPSGAPFLENANSTISWSVPGVEDGETPYTGTGVVDAFEINFSGGGTIDAASVGVSGCGGLGTEMCTGTSGIPWTVTSLTPTSIFFRAPAGEYLSSGTDFFVNVYFTGAAPTQFNGSFDLTPEPAVWSMMILGVGMAGFGLRRKQRAAKAV